MVLSYKFYINQYSSASVIVSTVSTVNGAGASSTILFTLDQISGFANFPNCREAGIESCARVNLNFDAFDNLITIFGTSLQRNLENDLDMDTKFFEVTLL